MASGFQGYLIKLIKGNSSYTIPLQFIQIETYQASPDQRQDLDSYRDADGLLHRTVLDHTATKIEFETPYLYMSQMQNLIQGIRRHYTNELAREVYAEYYDEETDSYKTGTFYLPGTMTYKMFNKQIYAPSRFAFIEY